MSALHATVRTLFVSVRLHLDEAADRHFPSGTMGFVDSGRHGTIACGYVSKGSCPRCFESFAAGVRLSVRNS
jgi:hypothetical protein